MTPTCLIGNVPVGSCHPVVVQSMTNTDTADVTATVRQVAALARAGSELVRVTVNNDEAAAALPEIVEGLDRIGVSVPIVGDFHYNGHLLLTRHPACATRARKVPDQSGQCRCQAPRRECERFAVDHDLFERDARRQRLDQHSCRREPPRRKDRDHHDRGQAVHHFARRRRAAPDGPPSPEPSPEPPPPTEPPPSCTYTVAPSQTAFGFAGGSATISVATADECSWIATSQSDWISIVGGSQSKGSTQASIEIAANASLSPRSGTVNVAGHIVPLEQAAAMPSCIYSLSPTAASSPRRRRTDRGDRRAGRMQLDCSQQRFVDLDLEPERQRGGFATGVGRAQSGTGSRTGTVTIAGKTFTLLQAGSPPCTSRSRQLRHRLL